MKQIWGIGIWIVIMGFIPMTFDFGTKNSAASRDWRVINDGVMGGLSQGRALLTEESILFEGEISLENNGGFSSLKSPFTSYDLSGKKYLKIRYRGSGQPMAFTLETNRRWYRPYFKKRLSSTSGQWVEERIELQDFEAYRIGSRLKQTLTEDFLEQIIRIGFISDGKQAGPFRFEVDYIIFE